VLFRSGIVNIHEFLCSKESNLDQENSEILSLSREDRAPRISMASEKNPLCGACLRLFVQMYARFASSMALTYLPKGGLFLAGGIAAKNKDWFIRDSLFMETFLRNYKESMKAALYNIPVYIVEDYGISLPGAAHGFFSLNQ
jgi:glucokinase